MKKIQRMLMSAIEFWRVKKSGVIITVAYRFLGECLQSLNLYFRSDTFSVMLKLEIIDRMDERSNNQS